MDVRIAVEDIEAETVQGVEGKAGVAKISTPRQRLTNNKSPYIIGAAVEVSPVVSQSIIILAEQSAARGGRCTCHYRGKVENNTKIEAAISTR